MNMIHTDYPAARLFHANTSYVAGNLPGDGGLKTGIKSTKEYPHAGRVKLPAPVIPDSNFRDVLFARHSCRKFHNQPLALINLANILFAGYGIRDTIRENEEEWTAHAVPSAGALYPLEFYILAIKVDGLIPGIYHYLPQSSCLEFIHTDAIPAQVLNRLFFQQSWIGGSGAIIVATAVFERTMSKYLDRGYRYILLEAGHAFQNMNLMAAACNTGAVNIGAFFDEELAALLQITTEEEVPIYATAVGVHLEGA